MDNTKTSPTILNPDHIVLNELYEDTMKMEPSLEREEALGEIWGLLGELAVQEQVRLSVENDIAQARELARLAAETRQKKTDVKEVPAERTHRLEEGDIGWIYGEHDVVLSKHETPEGKVFWLGRTTELSNKTAIDPSFISDRAYDEVEGIIAQHIGLKLDAPDQRVRELRPLHKYNTTIKKTEFTAFSDDGIVPQGYRNGDIRALVLSGTADPAAEGEAPEPMFLVASVCRHDEDKSKIYGL